MSVQALKQPVGANWRSTLAELAPLLAEEERRCDETNQFVANNFAALRERGFLELAVPVEFGGAGLTRTELAEMLRTLARHCSSTALALAMHTHVLAGTVWRWHHQKAPVEGLLKKVAAERLQLLTSGGSDWLAGSGKAVKVDGGYRISARKTFASGAPSASLFMTGAIDEDTPEGRTVLHFGVPMNATGVSIKETWDALGMRGTASHDVLLDDVFVPDAAIAARRKPGVWHPIFNLVIMVALPLVYAVYAGLAEEARDLAVAAAARRRDGGVADPGIVDLVGALDTELAATRIALESMVALAETAEPSESTTNTICTYRALLARAACRTVDLALEVAGGASFHRRNGLERLFRDMQGARFHPMPEYRQRQFAGRVALGLPIDG